MKRTSKIIASVALALAVVVIGLGTAVLTNFLMVRASNPNRYEKADEEWESASAALENIGMGWNLGNTLDCLNGADPSLPPVEGYETAWGNPVTTPEMIAMVADAGFGGVRVPVTWGTHMDEQGKIDPAWMDRVEEIVGYVLDEGMYCIINVHHDTGADGWLRASYSGFDAMSARFVGIWEQVCERFADYGEKLMFEGYNEILNEENNWSDAGEEGFAAANELNQLFVDAVRQSGGNNVRRNLIVNTYAAAISDAALYSFAIPKDRWSNHLIMEIHTYSPSALVSTPEDGVGQTRPTEADRAAKRREIFRLATRSAFLGVPLVIGEFGNMWKGDEQGSVEYAEMMAQTLADFNITGFVWDDGGWFEILDRRNLKWLRPGVPEALNAYR